MNRNNLREAVKLEDQIKRNDRVIAYLDRNNCESSDRRKQKPEDTVVEFLTKCSNLGDSSIRQTLSLVFIKEGAEVLRRQNEELEKRIENL